MTKKLLPHESVYSSPGQADSFEISSIQGAGNFFSMTFHLLISVTPRDKFNPSVKSAGRKPLWPPWLHAPPARCIALAPSLTPRSSDSVSAHPSLCTCPASPTFLRVRGPRTHLQGWQKRPHVFLSLLLFNSLIPIQNCARDLFPFTQVEQFY